MMTLVLPLANCKKPRHRSQVASAPLTVNILKQPLDLHSCDLQTVLQSRMTYRRCALFSPKNGRTKTQMKMSDYSPACNLSALSSVGADIKRTIQDIPDASALLSVAMKYEDGSLSAKIASSLLDQDIEVERPFVQSRNSPGDVLFERAMLIVVILPL
jgi:hypothetical protein